MPAKPGLPTTLEWRRIPDRRTIQDVEKLLRNTGVFSEEEISIGAEMVSETIGNPGDYAFLLAYDGNRLAAYSCYGPTSFTDARYDLYWIAVDPAFGGQGLGGELLRRTENLMAQEGAKKVYAETSGTDAYDAARRFYLKSGYDIAAVLNDFYADGNDKIIFSKSLSKI